MSQYELRRRNIKPRRLNDTEIAFVMEQHTAAKIEGRIKNFWWACGKGMGVDGDRLRELVEAAKKVGMQTQNQWRS